MSGGRRYYFGAEQRYKNSGDKDDDPLYPCDDNNNSNGNGNGNKAKANNDPEPEADADADADKDEFDSEFLQDVPYSSSSIDRSSVGSIPWADDAIKKNKLDWERVDRMLSGEEALPEQEVELRHEIADWQRRFPSLLARKAKPLKQQSFDNGHSHPTVPDDSAEIESLSDLSLNSLDDYDERDEDEEDDGFLTPTVDRPQAMPSTRHYQRSTQNQRLVAMLDRDLRITSVALNLRKREHSQKPIQPAPVPTTPQSATVTRSRLRMPPILNVLDSNRRFRGLLNNRSFVQLTQVQQQPKSAALTYASSAERRQQAGIRSAWNVPLATSRFLNNKHAIVLPSLNRHRDFTATATTSSQSISNSSSLESTRRGMGHNNVHQQSHPHQQQQQIQYGLTLGEISTNANNTPSTGRSISAAIHHPRSEFATSSAFYIPYSASKFKAFK